MAEITPVKRGTPFIANITMERGDDVPIRAVVKVGTTVENITGCSMRFMVKSKLVDDNADAIISLSVGSGIVLTDATNGVATATIPRADTEELNLTSSANKTYKWEWEYTNGGLRTTIGKGDLVIVPDVIQP